MIEIINLTKRYGDLIAVSGLNLKIPEGEIFGFLGPNGAGKTTTVKILAGILRPTEGIVRIGGFDIQRESSRAKKITGFIPDNLFIYNKLTGREFLDFVCDLYSINGSEVDRRREELFRLFELNGWEDDLIEGYSHGMRQKLVISAALIHAPKVIIVDEPMVGLDPRGAMKVKEIFRNLSKKGVIIFMSTHSLETAQEMCHRIGIIQQGRLIALGSIEDLKRDVRTEDTRLEDIFLELTKDNN